MPSITTHKTVITTETKPAASTARTAVDLGPVPTVDLLKEIQHRIELKEMQSKKKFVIMGPPGAGVPSLLFCASHDPRASFVGTVAFYTCVSYREGHSV